MKKARLHEIIREELHNVINESIVPDLYKSVPDTMRIISLSQI